MTDAMVAAFLFSGRIDDDIDAAVELPARRAVVGRHRECRAVAARIDARPLDAARDERALHRGRPALRELAVRLDRAGAVGKALDSDVAIGLAAQELREIVDHALRAGLERRAAALEQQVVAQRQHPAASGLLRRQVGDLGFQAPQLRGELGAFLPLALAWGRALPRVGLLELLRALFRLDLGERALRRPRLRLRDGRFALPGLEH